MTIYPELRSRIDKKGVAALRLVVQENTIKRYITLPIKLKPSEWDKETRKVKSSHPQAGAINTGLRLRIAQMEVDYFTGKDKIVTEKTLFKAYATECLGRWEKTKNESTLRGYRSKLRQVVRFDPDVLLEDMDATWLLKYDAWSRKDGCSSAGTLKRVAFISTVLREAMRYGLISSNPFLVYQRPAGTAPQKIWLTMDEVNAIESMHTNSLTLQNTAIWFLFSCYTGLRYSDVEKFDPTLHINGGRIILYTTKTMEVVSIKINSQCQRILDRWPKQEIFTNQKCNQYLKALAHVCGIDKRLTFHTARHTFAVQCANLGISQEVTSKLLGHSDLKTTAIYYKIVNARIDIEMEKWG